MTMAPSYTIIFTCILFVSAVNCHTDPHSEVDNERAFSYHDTHGNGPENWGSLNPEWEQCRTGKLQSPIDLRNKKRVVFMPANETLKMTYNPAPAAIKNRGHDILVEWEKDAGSVEINGTEYKLIQAHWHTPSEHTIKGKRFDMEMHMVHTSHDGRIAVNAILYNLGRPDLFLTHLMDEIHSVTEDEIHAGRIDPREIKFGSSRFYRYIGSLTVPPCTEGVTWTVLRRKKTVSREQILALRNAVHDGFEDNARPTQK